MTRFHAMHASLQFGDTDAQHTHDIEAIFGRAQDRKVSWITGTEAGPGAGNTSSELVRVGKAHGFRMWVPSSVKGASAAKGGTTDCWIAVAKDLIAGNWEQGFDAVIPGSRALYEQSGQNPEQFPRWGTKGLVHCAFDTEEWGRFNIGAAHYLTQARHPGAVVKGVDHWEWNRRLGSHIGDWAASVGAGSAKVFYGGDQNMADSKNDQPQGDTFFGKPLTSLADELKRWQNTGHGPIDVMASYDPDVTVEGAYFRVLDDSEFSLNVDHFLCEGGWDVKPLKAKPEPPKPVEHSCPACGNVHTGVVKTA